MEKFWRELDKFFSTNKLFVIFCGVLIAVWLSLQAVIHLRIIETAKLEAARIFTWSWPTKDFVLTSSIESPTAQVINKSANEVLVKVIVTQRLEKHRIPPPPADTVVQRSLDCEAILTYYRSDNRWILGKVELK
jgi:hypothetical protein